MMTTIKDRERHCQQDSAGTALVVHPDLNQESEQVVDDKLQEAVGLAQAISLDVMDARSVSIKMPVAGYLISKGHRQDIGHLVDETHPDVIIVNHNLTPIQQRNLEKEWDAKVIDRTGLILEIFGRRAQTKEGKIQVELAALEYQKSRLVKSWTHLERQRGGLGKTGGPGETQIEIDRRLIRERIARLKKEMKNIRKNRDLQRRSREQVPFPVVALVGYTNAGKSTLFNFITGATVFAEDLLFATLDPTMRKKEMKDAPDVIFSDTVGFIANLPTHLIAAFRATLEQVQYADVILHVRDMARSDCDHQKAQVISILKDLGIEYERDFRIIEVWNKIDLLSADDKNDLCRKAKFADHIAPLSAVTGEGVEGLLSMIKDCLLTSNVISYFQIPASDGRAMAWLYQNAHVWECQEQEGMMMVQVHISPEHLGRFIERFSYYPEESKGDGKEYIYDGKY